MKTAPRIMPDELLASYISRTATLTGLKESDKFYETVINLIDNPSQHSLNLTTTYKAEKIEKKRKGWPIFTNYHMSSLKYCTACHEADLQKFGFTYYRTYHQSTMFLVCPEHGMYLKSHCTEYHQKINHLMPDLKSTKEDLVKISELIQVSYKSKGGSFSVNPAQNYIRRIIDERYSATQISYYDFFDSIASLNLLNIISTLFYENYTRQSFEKYLYYYCTSHEELIVYYYLLTKNPNTDHFLSLIEH